MQYSVKLLVAALFALSPAAHPALRDFALAAAQVDEVGVATEGLVAPAEAVLAEPLTTAPADPAVDLVLADQTPPETAPAEAGNEGGLTWWWLLLPLAALGGLAWALSRSRRGLAPGAEGSIVPPVTGEQPVPPPTPPATAEHPVPSPVPPTTAESPVPPPVPPVTAEPPVSPPDLPTVDEASVSPSDLPTVDEALVSPPELSAEAPVSPPDLPTVDEAPVSPPVLPTVDESLAEIPSPPPATIDGPLDDSVAAAMPTVPGVIPVESEPEPEPELDPVPPTVATPEIDPEIITVNEVPPSPESDTSSVVPAQVSPPAGPMPMAMGVAGLAAGAAASLASTEDQSAVEASKFNVVGRPAEGDFDLSTIDDGLPPLPDGYGDSRIVLMARDPQWAYAYWDTPHTHKEDLRRQGGEHLALRLYDVTGINLDSQAPHSLQQVGCDEMAREWYMQIPVSDRDYQVEIGYLAGDGRWLVLARSNTIRIPPVYPSDWTEEHFLTVAWQENLRGQTIVTLVDPSALGADAGLHEQLYALAQGGEALRVDGSLFGSMQHVVGSMTPPISSFIYASGAGLGAAAMVPGLTMSGVSGFTLSGFPGPTAEFPGLTMSGVSGFGVSGAGVSGLTMSGFSGLTLSGVGLGASMPPLHPRKFWLVAEAELIVYGATEPDASVTVAGVPIKLSEDGTFRFQTSFQDGTIDYPIMAVAADGEQSRNIHLTFERRTPDRNTNTKDEAQDEWPSM